MKFQSNIYAFFYPNLSVFLSRLFNFWFKMAVIGVLSCCSLSTKESNVVVMLFLTHFQVGVDLVNGHPLLNPFYMKESPIDMYISQHFHSKKSEKKFSAQKWSFQSRISSVNMPLRIRSLLLKKSLIKNFIFRVVDIIQVIRNSLGSFSLPLSISVHSVSPSVYDIVDELVVFEKLWQVIY